MPEASLDRQGRIPSNVRTTRPDWDQLLFYGIRAVTEGWVEEAPYLSDVMFRGVDERKIFARATVFDAALLLEWLMVDEHDALAYIKSQLGGLWAPIDSADAREILERFDCLAQKFGTHRLRATMAVHYEDDVEWAAGWCLDCLQALLWRLPDGEASSVTTWSFYDPRGGM